MTDITQADLDRLTGWDTPTICNGLEALDESTRLVGYTNRQFTCLRPEAKPIVGYARTATIRASVRPSGTAAEQSAMRDAYYAHIDTGGPKPSIVVIQDLDDHPGTGAWWGEVNTTVHLGLGCLGVVTNGSIRDLADSAPGFQSLAGQVGPSHAWVHVTSFGETVQVHGMTVRDGDIVHADVHGAVVIAPEHVKALPGAIERIAAREAVILDAARAPGFDAAKLAAARKG